MKMHENAQVSRRWWKDVAEYCERQSKFPNQSLLFKTFRGYPNAIEDGLEVVEMFKAIDSKLPSDTSACGQKWEMCVAEKELYGAVKFVSGEECAHLISRVPHARGY